MSAYAWIITRDLLCEEYGGDTEVGTTGPRDASDELINELKMGTGYTFNIYDDDSIHYYVGRIISTNIDQDCSAPLEDFGTPNAGAVSITYPGYSHLDCG